MRVSPNPARAGATFAIDAARAGKQELVIRDLQGRTIRVLERGLFPKGSRVAHWDGRNELGARVRPGIYLGSLQAPPETVITRFTVVN
jgi:hypothetical protein